MNIYDIAQLSGVSIATVSRVINNKPGVSEEAKSRVLGAIEKTNFIPNQLAKSLANKKSYVIGIVMPGINNYYSQRIDAIHKVCKEEGYSLMITANYRNTNSIEDDIGNFNLLIEKRVDGIIYFPTHVSDAHIELLKRIKGSIPIVVTDSEISEVNLACVIQDSINPTKEIMKYLVKGGHRHIAFINGPNYDKVNNKRYETFRAFLKDSDIEFDETYLETGNFSLESGYEAMQRLLEKASQEKEETMTAVFASNDNMAMGAIKAIYDAGLHVPEDISVIGYDGIEFGQYCCPSLTTVKINQYKIGEIAAETLIEEIEYKSVKNKKLVMDYEVLIKGSSRRLI
jgi:DNA-binding LacI/PurR family transcriptional regulator